MLIRARPSGYGFHSKLASGEAEIIDSQLPNALDAIGGGSYSATAPVVWDGFWTYTGSLTVNGNMLIEGGTLNILSPSTFADTATFLFGVSVQSNITITGATHLLSVDATAATPTFGSGLHVTGGPTTLDGTATTVNTATLEVSAGTGTSFFGGVTFGITTGVVDHFAPVSFQTSAPIDQKSIITLNGPFGHIKWRRINGSASNTSYSIADADVIIVQPGTLAGTTIYTMLNTGCTGGEKIKIQCNDGGTFQLQVRQHNGVTGISILLTSTKLIGVELMNNGSGSVSSAWEVIGYTTNP